MSFHFDPTGALSSTSLSSLDVPKVILVPAAAFGSLGAVLGGRAEPGVYVLHYEDVPGGVRRYIGASGHDVIRRVRSHLHPRADGIIGVCLIVGRAKPMGADEAFTLERIIHQVLLEAGEHLNRGLPHGAHVSRGRYANIRVRAGLLALDLARLGVVSPQAGLRALVAGPRGYRRGLDGDRHPDLARARLTTKEASALVIIDADGHPHLQPGSSIRRRCSSQIGCPTHVARLEAIWGGAVSDDGLVLQPLAFTSWSGLSRFVLGAQAGGPGQWVLASGAPVTTRNTRLIREVILRMNADRSAPVAEMRDERRVEELGRSSEGYESSPLPAVHADGDDLTNGEGYRHD